MSYILTEEQLQKLGRLSPAAKENDLKLRELAKRMRAAFVADGYLDNTGAWLDELDALLGAP